MEERRRLGLAGMVIFSVIFTFLIFLIIIQMERLYQMSVVPDVLPVIKPSLDLHLIIRTRPTEFIEEKKIQTHVEPGSFVKPKQVISHPTAVLKRFVHSPL
jgi:hypothetical protein